MREKESGGKEKERERERERESKFRQSTDRLLANFFELKRSKKFRNQSRNPSIGNCESTI